MKRLRGERSPVQPQRARPCFFLFSFRVRYVVLTNLRPYLQYFCCSFLLTLLLELC